MNYSFDALDSGQFLVVWELPLPVGKTLKIRGEPVLEKKWNKVGRDRPLVMIEGRSKARAKAQLAHAQVYTYRTGREALSRGENVCRCERVARSTPGPPRSRDRSYGANAYQFCRRETEPSERTFSIPKALSNTIRLFSLSISLCVCVRPRLRVSHYGFGLSWLPPRLRDRAEPSYQRMTANSTNLTILQKSTIFPIDSYAKFSLLRSKTPSLSVFFFSPISTYKISGFSFFSTNASFPRILHDDFFTIFGLGRHFWHLRSNKNWDYLLSIVKEKKQISSLFYFSSLIYIWCHSWTSLFTTNFRTFYFSG